MAGPGAAGWPDGPRSVARALDAQHVIPGQREDVPAHDGVDPLRSGTRRTIRTRCHRAPFPLFFTNSVIVSTVVMVGNVVFCTLAGYGLAKFRFPGDRFALLAILSTLMLPLEVTLVPTFLIVHSLGWLNTYQGIIAPLLVDAFGIFLMRQFVLGVPSDYLRSRPHRRSGRAAHPLEDRAASVQAGAGRAGPLRLPRQLGPVPVAAGRGLARSSTARTPWDWCSSRRTTATRRRSRWRSR